MIPLPIDDLLPELDATLRSARALVLSAPPGAGKTTRVPPRVLDLLGPGGGEHVLVHIEAACNHPFGTFAFEWDDAEVHRRWNSDTPGQLERAELAVLDDSTLDQLGKASRPVRSKRARSRSWWKSSGTRRVSIRPSHHSVPAIRSPRSGRRWC